MGWVLTALSRDGGSWRRNRGGFGVWALAAHQFTERRGWRGRCRSEGLEVTAKRNLVRGRAKCDTLEGGSPDRLLAGAGYDRPVAEGGIVPLVVACEPLPRKRCHAGR
jgi:hypothetical protein